MSAKRRHRQTGQCCTMGKHEWLKLASKWPMCCQFRLKLRIITTIKAITKRTESPDSRQVEEKWHYYSSSIVFLGWKVISYCVGNKKTLKAKAVKMVFRSPHHFPFCHIHLKQNWQWQFPYHLLLQLWFLSDSTINCV